MLGDWAIAVKCSLSADPALFQLETGYDTAQNCN